MDYFAHTVKLADGDSGRVTQGRDGRVRLTPQDSSESWGS